MVYTTLGLIGWNLDSAFQRKPKIHTNGLALRYTKTPTHRTIDHWSLGIKFGWNQVRMPQTMKNSPAEPQAPAIETPEVCHRGQPRLWSRVPSENLK